MNVHGSEACAEIHLGSVVVFACGVNRQGVLSSQGMILKEPLI